MTPRTFQRLRSLHRWAGLFFAPMIILFAITGMFQVLNAEDWTMPSWLYPVYDALEAAHQNQQLREDTNLQTAATILAVVMSLALTLTTLLGIAMAYKMFPKKRVLISIVLVLGITLPVILMWL